MHAQWSGIHRSARGPFAYARSLSLSSFLSSGQDGVHLTADPFVDRVPQFQRSAVAVCGPRVQFSSPVGTRSVDTPSTPDPHDMYVFEVRGVITCCIVCNTNKTEHLLGGARPPRLILSLAPRGRVVYWSVRCCLLGRVRAAADSTHAPSGRVACPPATERRF